MEGTEMRRPAGEVLAEIATLLDCLEVECGLLTDAERLVVVAAAQRVSGRVQAVAATLAADAADAGVAERSVGVPLVSWLAATERLTRREAFRLIGRGRDLARFPRLAGASLAGGVSFDQANAIAGVLTALPAEFGPAQLAEAEAVMVGHAAVFDSAGLCRLSRRLVEVLDPDGAEGREADRLERELRQARAGRSLSFWADGHGSVLIRGQLPTLDAEPFISLVEAYAHTERRHALDRIDPHAEASTPAKRRADGLCALVAAHQREALAPSCGGDRPRVVVTLDYHRLHHDCVTAGLLGSGQPISAGQLRRLACDAEILPVVLGAGSEVLDVGRARRLVTPTIRLALTLRDRGCVFPGCDVPAHACEAHHLVPWWAGGTTAVGSLVLLCPHHHGLVEPGRDGPPGQRWDVRLGHDNLPEVLPPIWVDPTRTPRRHQRFTLPAVI